MNVTHKFYFRNVRKNSSIGCIYLRITINRRCVVKSLRTMINSKLFDEQKERCKGKSIESQELNAIMDHYQHIISKYKIRCITENHRPVLSEIMMLIDIDLSENGDFYAFAEKFLIPMKKKEVKRGCWKKYLTEVNKMKCFKSRLTFSEINDNFIIDYLDYCRKVRHNNENTVNRSIIQIKSIVNTAVKNGFCTKNNINIHSKHIEAEIIFLSRSELKLFYDYVMSSPDEKIVKVGTSFLFQVFTGLRYSDMRDLKWRDINENFIRRKQIKTGDLVIIPMNKWALSIVKNVPRIGNEKVIPSYSNQVSNRILKDIAKKCGINKEISTHTARHTFATVSIELGVPLIIVSKLLGHKTVKTTEIYLHLVDNLKAREMSKWDHIFE